MGWNGTHSSWRSGPDWDWNWLGRCVRCGRQIYGRNPGLVGEIWNRDRLRAAHRTDLPLGVVPAIGVVLRERWRLSVAIGLQHIAADAILRGLDDLGFGCFFDKTVARVSFHMFFQSRS